VPWIFFFTWRNLRCDGTRRTRQSSARRSTQLAE
jgi:hypothetical protein